jgi:hypothetical protein
LIFKKGNTTFLGVAATDSDGNIITTLATANDIKFQLKETKAGSAKISKDLSDGVTADRDKNNNVVVGSIRVVLTASDIDSLTPGTNYFISVQAEWTNNIQEIWLTEDSQILEYITVKEDVI